MNATQTVSTGSGSFRPTGRTAGRKYCRSLAAVIGLMAVLTAVPALAVAYSDGTLDSTFGTGGIVTTNFNGTGDVGNALTIQSDGKIVVAGTSGTTSGDFAVARYNSDGSLDTSFGTGGKVTTDIGSTTNDSAYSVVVQSDGKIVVAGDSKISVSNQDSAVVRYNADGSLDTGFGTGGKVITDVGSSTADRAYSVALQTDGKIVVGGDFITTAPNSDLYVLRYNANGSLDTGFGTGGIATSHPSSNTTVPSISLQSDGKIVESGSAYAGVGNSNFATVRYNTDGSLDATFGTGGIVVTDIGSSTNDYPLSQTIQSNGKIIAAGYRYSGATSDAALVRYNTDGSLDATFGTGGKVTTDLGATNDRMRSVAIQGDGKIVGVGGNGGFVTVRYNTDGSLDATFGTGGKVTTNIGVNDAAASVAIQSDGKIVAAGASSSGGPATFAVIRFGAAGAAVTTTTAAATTTTLAGSTVTTSTVSGSSSGTSAPSDKVINSLSVKNIVSNDSVQAGGSVTVEATGFTPSESVSVGVQGSKASVRSATADSRGAITAKVSIPSTAKGKVTIYAYGRTSKHGYRDTVTILKSETIPRTGTDLSVPAFLGAMFLAVGLLVSAQRRIVR